MSRTERSATLTGLVIGAMVGGFLWYAYSWVVGMSNDYRWLRSFEATSSQTLIWLTAVCALGGAFLGRATQKW